MDIINSSIIIYSIKSDFLKNKFNPKLLYIFLYSPVLLTTGFFYKDIVSFNYWKFLLSLTFPEYNCKKIKNNIEENNTECKLYHKNENSCYLAFYNNYTKTIIRTSSMYSKFYIINTLFNVLTVNKTKNKVQLLINTISSILYSTVFLSGQTILMRILLCNTNLKSKILLYFISLISSLPILFERNTRVIQVNNMIISNLVIGCLKKLNTSNYIYKIIILLTILKEKKINKLNILLSLLNSKISYSN